MAKNEWGDELVSTGGGSDWGDEPVIDAASPADSGGGFSLSEQPSARQELPAGVTPSTAGAGRGNAGLADYRAKAEAQTAAPARAAWEDHADQLMADTAGSDPSGVSVLQKQGMGEQSPSARLALGAGPLSQRGVDQARNVAVGRATSTDPAINRAATSIQRGADASVQRVNTPEIKRIAQRQTADEWRSVGEWANDSAAALASGAVSMVQLPVNIIAPGSALHESLVKSQQNLQDFESEPMKARRAQLAERVKSEDGFLDQYAATVSELVTNPSVAIHETLRQVAMFAGVLGAAKVGGAVGQGAVTVAGRASPTLALGEAISGGTIGASAAGIGSTAGGIGASSVMAAGDAAGNAYDKLMSAPQSMWDQSEDYQRLIAKGMDPQQAKQEVSTAKARTAAMIAAPLGVLGFMGAEASFAGKAAARGTPLRTFATEMVTEPAEEALTQVAGNYAVQTINPEQDIAEGAGEAAGMATVTSGPFATAGAINEVRRPVDRTPQIEALRKAGDETAAALLERRQNTEMAAFTTERETEALAGFGPDVQQRYRDTRLAGAKTGDAVVQTAARWNFEQAAQLASLSPKAQEAIANKLAEIPAEKAAGFVQKAITGLVNAGQAQPFDGLDTLAQTIETQRDQMLDSVLATMADIESLEQQNATQEATPAAVDTAAVEAQGLGGAGVDGVDEQGAVPALSDINDVMVTPELDAVHAAATSPLNNLPEPTDAQKKAGNYKVGKIRMSGLDISIENPQGSERRGVDPDGKEWTTPMRDHYGYFKGTTAADGDKLDVFIKPGTPQDYAGPVFVVDQVDPKTGKFDEHKVVFGAADQAEAEAIYRRNYSADWNGLANITALPMPAFKAWAASKATRKPLGAITEQANVQNAAPGTEAQAAAAPVEASTPARGDAAATAGLPAADGAGDVQADGVNLSKNQPILNTSEERAQETSKTAQVEMLGQNSQPLSEGGKPFKTELAARKEKKLHPDKRVVKSPDGKGFILKTMSAKQIAAQEAAARRIKSADTGEDGPMSAHGFILGRGGLAKSSMADAGFDKNVRIGNRWLFTDSGKTLAQAGMDLKEAGFITDETENAASDIIRRSIASPQYTPEGWEAVAEAEAQTRFEDHLKAQQESEEDPFASLVDDGYAADDAEGTGFDQASLAIQAEVAALSVHMETIGRDPVDIMERLALQYPDDTQKEFHERAKAALTQAVAEAAQPAGRGDTGQDGGESGQAREGTGESLTDRPDGTLSVKGDTKALRERLTASGIPAKSILPSATGVVIGRTQAHKAREVLTQALTAPTKSDIESQQERVSRADEFDARAQVKRESEAGADSFTLTVEDGRQDDTGTLFAVDDAGKAGDTADYGQPDTSPEARINIGLLGRDIAAYLGESRAKLDAVHPYVGRRIPQGEALGEIAQAFNAEIQGFGLRPDLTQAQKNHYGFFGGVRTSGVVFLRTDGNDRPHLAVLGHELAHELASKRPDLYKQLVLAINPYVDAFRYRTEFVNSVVAKNAEGTRKKTEEFIGEVLSDGFMDPEFWRALGQKNPSLLQHVGDFVFDMIEKAMKALGYTKRSAPYLTDYKAVMRIAGEVMAEYGVAPRGARGDVPFSRPLTADLFRQMTTPMQRGMKTADLQKAIAPVLKRWENGPNVTVVATTKDLPMSAPGDVHGVYFGGKVYLVAQNIRDKAKAMEVLTHEAIAHHGLREMLGKDDWKKFMANIQLALKTGNKPLAAIRKDVHAAYVDDAGKFNLSEMQEADEIAAKVVEQAVDADGNFRPGFGFVKSVYAKVVEFLRGIGIDVKMTMAELQGALVNAQRFLEVGKKAGSAREAKEPVFMRSESPSISTAIIGANLGAATSHPRYAEAKSGDIDAAVDVARALVTPDLVDHVRAAIGDSKPVVVPVVSVEASGNNKIPLASAEVLASKLGLETTTGIVQSNSPKRTAMDGLDRIFSSPEFDGPVVIGQDYVILDDTLTQGATFAALAAHIESGGGRVVSAVALTGKQYSARIQPSSETLKSLREKHGDIESVFQAATGYGFDALTESEARYLANFKPAQSVRDRILAEGRSRSERQNSGTAGGVAFSRTAKAPASIEAETTAGAAKPAQAEMFQPGFWDAPQETNLDKVIFELQDGRIDLKRVQEAITKTNTIPEKFDARLQETLYPGRVATRSKQFLDDEAKPLLDAMARNNVTMSDLADYLHARHAEERNKQIAKVNPDLPDGGAGKNSKGVLMTTEAAKQHIAGLSEGKRMVLDAMAKRVDAITQGTTKLLVDEGLEKQETIDAWTGAYKSYVPLFRDEAENGNPHPTGSGMSVRGGSSKRAVGSTKQATNILAHVLMQREAAITRAEKNRVAVALYGLALTNPNPDFWTTIKPGMSPEAIGRELQRMGVDPTVAEAGMMGVPTIKTVDPTLGRVVSRPNPMYKSLPGAIVLKVNGEDRVLMVNVNDPRGLRMAENLKNMDGLTKFDIAGSIVGKATRWMASVNTQYNPAFGLVNLTRDTLGGAINLSSTKLRGKTMKVLAMTPGALKGIGLELSGKKSGEWGRLFRQFQQDGGQTGYREMFKDASDRAKALEAELKAMEKAGKLTTDKVAGKVLGALDIFNTTLENAVRLAAYREALQEGMSRPEAARLGRELTVDFNRKGRMGRELGPLYAFFNASVQGSARTLQTLAGPDGAKIIAGGVSLGVLQAVMLLAAGYDDDEIPEFVKSRALIIPLGTDDEGKKRYFTIPLPLGLHVLPNTGRVLAELTMDGGKDALSKGFEAVGEIAGAFNPLGGGNIFTADGALRTVAPTVIDPVIEVLSNKNFAGTAIEREGYGNDPRPGFERAREGTLRAPTGQAYLEISRILNKVSGGDEYEAGRVSPTPEMVRYLAQVVGGGLLREIEKTVNTSIAMSKGEDTKPTGLPVFGRFYGEVDDASVQRSRYYDNLTAIEKAEKLIRAAEKKGDLDAADRIEADKPEAMLKKEKNRAVKDLRELNKEAMETVGDSEAIKALDEERTAVMRELNEAAREIDAPRRDATLGAKVRKALADVNP